MESNIFLSKLEASKQFYSESELKVYDFIIENIKAIPSLKLSDLSSKCKVSEATIIRFARKLGFKGFSDFKISLSQNIHNIQEQYDLITDLDTTDSVLTIYKKLVNFSISSMNTTAESINENDFENAVNLIDKISASGKRIFIVGAGASTLLAESLRIKLMRLNIDSIHFSDSHLQLEAMSGIEHGDLLIAFTTLAKTSQTNDCIEIAKNHHARIILITQYANQSLIDKGDIALYFSTIETNLRLASQTAILVQSLIIDAIFLALAVKDFEKIKKNVDNTKKLFDELGYYK